MQKSYSQTQEMRGGFGFAEQLLDSGVKKAACPSFDVRRPVMSNLELQAKLNAERSEIPIILIRSSKNTSSRLTTSEDPDLPVDESPFVRADKSRNGRSFDRFWTWRRNTWVSLDPMEARST